MLDAGCPLDFVSSDWRLFRGRGRPPAFHDYVCHFACHWIAPLNLYVARTYEPHVPWRLITSSEHTTVWDVKDRLWDTNYLALEVPVEEAIMATFEQDDFKEWQPHFLCFHFENLNPVYWMQELKNWIAEEQAERSLA
ncbi:MAG: hypothetical protein ACR2OW_09210 [Methyloligellaceae bacterium]